MKDKAVPAKGCSMDSFAGRGAKGVPAFRADCPCPKLKCRLHGRCVECREKHSRKGKLPRCERSEKRA